MKLSLTAAAMLAASLPAAPALAHCGSHHKAVHRTVVHRVAYRAPVRRVGCGCATTRVAYRETFVPPPPLYRRPLTRVVYVERPFYRPFYRPVVYRPRPIYFGEARWERGPRWGYRHARYERGGWGGYPRHAWR
ncbi:MAG: hypothetical protein QOE79_1986 [Sphingomonadales bacterium]|jgi:hypothetical protein|nr:hypothetical protein [Sphingomonadales bacterium]MEA3049954.1 hypothetical protein [Sphingomonadales bacterium]